jgi:hypothetical protein
MQTQSDFKVTLKVGVKNDDTGRLIRPMEKYEIVISPPRIEYSNQQALHLRCEALAVDSWGRELQRRIDSDFKLQRDLSGVEWSTFTNTIRVIEKVQKNGR